MHFLSKNQFALVIPSFIKYVDADVHAAWPTSYMLFFPRCTANVVHAPLPTLYGQRRARFPLLHLPPPPFVLKKRRTGGETASFKLKEGVRTALWDPMNPNQFAAATEGKSIP